MKIQKSTDYAIRILRYLHSYTSYKSDVLTAQTIAEAIGMSYPFFIKTANQLKNKDLITSIQGRNGGYRIARSGDKISIYDVFLAIEGELNIYSCCPQEGAQCDCSTARCAVHGYFKDVQQTLIGAMASRKISDFDTAISD